MSEPDLIIYPAKARGRPRVSEPRMPVSSRLKMSEYDALAQRAIRHGISVSELVRRAVIRDLSRR